MSQQSTTTSARRDAGASSPARFAPFDRPDGDEGIDRREAPARRRDLRRAHVGGRVQDLALQIGEIDAVGIGERERSDTGGGEELRDRCAQSADAHDEVTRGGEALLRLDAELGQQDVPAVAKEAGVVQRTGSRCICGPAER